MLCVVILALNHIITLVLTADKRHSGHIGCTTLTDLRLKMTIKNKISEGSYSCNFIVHVGTYGSKLSSQFKKVTNSKWVGSRAIIHGRMNLIQQRQKEKSMI